MSTSDRDVRVRPIISTDTNTVSVADSPYSGNADKPAPRRPWMHIGRHLLGGIPFTVTPNGRGRFAGSGAGSRDHG
jgi:hypothetical protein